MEDAPKTARALMTECAAWFHPEHFAAVVEERASLVRARPCDMTDRLND